MFLIIYRSCDMLRCTDCDFHVEMFDDVSWHPKTDYLFLRNNIPDYDKVKVNLVTRKGEKRGQRNEKDILKECVRW